LGLITSRGGRGLLREHLEETTSSANRSTVDPDIVIDEVTDEVPGERHEDPAAPVVEARAEATPQEDIPAGSSAPENDLTVTQEDDPSPASQEDVEPVAEAEATEAPVAVESAATEPVEAESIEPEPAEVVGEGDGDGKKPKKPAKVKLPGRDPIWAWSILVFGVVLVLLSGTAVVGSRVLASRYDSAVNKQTLLAPEARATGVPPAERTSTVRGPLNFLLLGSDLRANNPEDGQRADTIIIAHVTASLDHAYLISIPRDLKVHIPGYGNQKINGAFQFGGGGAGGVQLLSQTITDFTGIKFDGAAIIDFSGFQTAVQILGGVHMCVDVRTESHHIGHDKNGNFLAPWDGPDGEHRNHNSTPVVYEPGCQHLAAWQALDYVRQRKGLPNGDYDRQRHQQQFLRALFDRAEAKDLTSNPVLFDKFVRAVGSSLTVDTNGVDTDELMFGLRNMRPGNMLGLQVPSAPEMIGGISYILPMQHDAEALYGALRSDTLDTWAAGNANWTNQI
jgi:LCP family protein required for cell wall assembly